MENIYDLLENNRKIVTVHGNSYKKVENMQQANEW